ncbi:hypothetical protein LCGC14_2983810, partial [marine sediment metagenome]
DVRAQKTVLRRQKKEDYWKVIKKADS